MKGSALVIFISLWLLVVCSQALVPDNVIITTDPEWLTAGSGETSVITLKVINQSSPSQPVAGAEVYVTCDDPAMGYIETPQIRVVGNSSQKVSFIFHAGNKSGDAVIRAVVSHPEMAGSLENTTVQHIDHARPQAFALLSYPASAPVGSTVDIQVRLKDRYGNIVDNRRESYYSTAPESISFSDSVDGDGWFIDGPSFVNSIIKPVDANGDAVVQYRLPTQAGESIILVRPPSTVTPVQTSITIRGYGNVTYEISAVMTPAHGVVYADGESVVEILYTVRDIHGNPVRNVTIVRTTSLGETDTFRTNEQGQVITTYGPKASAGTVQLTAGVEGYPDIYVISHLVFLHTDPVTWELTASPQTLASRDVREDITADIRAKVMDAMGNPVPGELVTFEIVNNTSTTTFTRLPELVNTSAITDEDGFAIVQLRPGAFPIYGQPGYNATATGTAKVRATWSGRTKDIVITFKNYPYLRVETSVSPQTVQVNETMDVTIRLIGDGWALQPTPIDVSIVFDRSGSMAWDNPTRISQAKSASITFVDQFDTSRDRIGLVSFSSSTTLDQSLSSNFQNVKNKINSLTANGATQLRNAAYTAIKDVQQNGRSNAVKAVILMTDGEWNYHGNPLGIGYGFTGNTATWPGTAPSFEAYQYYSDLGGGIYKNSKVPVPNGGIEYDPVRGIYIADTTNQTVWHYEDGEKSQQNLTIYAKNNNIRIYAITFAHQPVNDCTDALSIMAESTGGFYEHAPDGAKLEEIYKKIAGELKTIAGANTQMNLSFENVSVTFNNVTHPMIGRDVFDYQYVNDISTFITSWNTTHNPMTGFPYTIDQSAQWSSGYLHFDAGNISINQTWQATFRLVPKVLGSINIFGPGSIITFNGTEGAYSSGIPDTFVTVIGEMDLTPFSQAVLDVEITGHSNVSESSPDFLDVYWTMNYTGNRTVKQTLYYQFSPDNVVWTNEWVKVKEVTTTGSVSPDQTFTGTIDIRGISGYIKLRVEGKEQLVGGVDDYDQFDETIPISTADRIYIKIT